MSEYETFGDYQRRAAAEFREWALSGKHALVLHEIHGVVPHAATRDEPLGFLSFIRPPPEPWDIVLDVHGEKHRFVVSSDVGRDLMRLGEAGWGLPSVVDVVFGESGVESVTPGGDLLLEGDRSRAFKDSLRGAWIANAEPHVRRWARGAMDDMQVRSFKPDPMDVWHAVVQADKTMTWWKGHVPAEWMTWVEDEMQRRQVVA